MDPHTDEDSRRRLVCAARVGDRSAFAELYRRYHVMVRSIALARLPRDDVSDAVQETFVRALRKLSALRDEAAFGQWIAVIARNVAGDLARERAGVQGLEHEPIRHGTQHEAVQAREALRAVRLLPKAYRRTVALRLQQGMTGPEIAHRTGLSAASVRVNLHRGMKLLRARLNVTAREKLAGSRAGFGGASASRTERSSADAIDGRTALRGRSRA